MSSSRKFSRISLITRTTFGIDEEINYEDMSDEQLKEYLEYLIHMNEVFILENEIFENYLRRNDSQSLIPMAQVLETARVMLMQNTELSLPHSHAPNSSFDVRGRNASISLRDSVQTFADSHGTQMSIMTQFTARGLRMSLSQRVEMVNKEIEEMKKELKKHERLAMKKKTNLRAQIEEIQMRIRDINEARDQFEENVIKKGTDPSTKKILAETFIHYFDTWLKNADQVIDKLRLKSSTLKSQIKKAKIQLQLREELGDSLDLIDFEALAIENNEYSKQIAEKTRELMELKKIDSQYNFTLNKYKDKLRKQEITLHNIKKDIGIKEKQIEKLDSDLEVAKNQLLKLEQRMERISISSSSDQSKDINEIVKIQSELIEMKKTYDRLKRHDKIQLTRLNAIKKHQLSINEIKNDEKKSN